MKPGDIETAWRVAETETAYDLKAWNVLDEPTRQVLTAFASECFEMGFKTAGLKAEPDPGKKGWRKWWGK